MAVGEGAAAEVNIDLVEGQPLRLMDGQGPCQAEWKLLERAGDRFDDFLGRLVERVAPMFPSDRLDLKLAATDLDKDLLLGQTRNARDGAVDSLLVGVIA